MSIFFSAPRNTLGWPRLLALLIGCLLACAAPAASRPVPKQAKPEYTLSPTVPQWVKPQSFNTLVDIAKDDHTGGLHYLLVDHQVFLDGSRRQQYLHRAWKIVNESGLEQAAHVEVGFDPSYQTLNIHAIRLWRDGRAQSRLSARTLRILQRESSLEERIYDGTKTANVFLEDVRVGDVVELAYTLSGSNPVFGEVHSGIFGMQWGTPVRSVHARLVTTGRPTPSWRAFGAELPATQEEEKALRATVWRSENVQPIRLAEGTPRSYNPFARVHWSEYDGWEGVAQWAQPLYETKAPQSAELKAEVEKLRQIPSEAGRIVQALRLVQSQVRYLGVEVGPGSFAPNPAETVWSRRFGDCKDKTLLTLTILRALGINASAALVNTKLRRSVREHLPMPGAFDHVLVRVMSADGTVYWLDPTRFPQEGGLDDISQPDFGYALVLEPAASTTQLRDLTEMKPAEAAILDRKVVSLLDLRGPPDVAPPMTVTTVLRGLSAEQTRSQLARRPPPEVQKDWTNFVGRFFPVVELVQPFEVFDDKENNQITVTEYYRLPHFWNLETSGRMRSYVDSPDIFEYLRAPRESVRTQPLGLPHPLRLLQTTLIQVPKNWSFQSGTSTVRDAAFTFRGTTKHVEGLLTVIDEFQSLADTVEPSATGTYLANLKKARELRGVSINQALANSP